MTKTPSKPHKPAPLQESASRKPAFRLHRVLGDGDAANWMAIGAAWPHKDGKGFSIVLDAVPLYGRIVMRAVPANADMSGGGQP